MEEIEFRISSGLKNIIGKELITNDLIAIFELVKNSYDANASYVKIAFRDIRDKDNEKNARILIIDDGEGMSYDDIIRKYLFVAYSDKRELEKKSGERNTNFRHKIQRKRFFAGAKGVGRFSCDRLGAELNLYTKKDDEDTIHHLYIDWGKFEKDQEKEFQKIKAQYSILNTLGIDDYDIEDFKRGTILEISSLNDTWPWRKIIKLKRYLQRLINPAQVDKYKEFNIYLEAEEYLKEDGNYHSRNEDWNMINGIIENILFEKLEIKTTQINSDIDEKGERIFTEVVDKGKFIFNMKEHNEYSRLKNISVKLFFLNREAKGAFTRLMGLHSVNYGSVFLYKNGIRIHPYGDDGDDWLSLEKRKGQGWKRFLATRELMGRIEINGYQPGFIEVSSRDGGIIKNEYYLQLVDFFMKKVLRRLERYVVEGIDWERKDSRKTQEDSLKLIERIAGRSKDPEVEIEFNKDLLEIFEEKEVEKIPELIKNVESLKKHVKKPEEKEYIDKQLKAVRRATRTLKKEKKKAERELEVTKKISLFMSKAVSTDKEIIMDLNHTIGNSTQAIKVSIEEINEKIKENKPILDVAPPVDEISLENEKIRVLSEFVSLANFNMKVEWITKDIILYITDYLRKIKSREIEFRFSNDILEFKTRFRPLEISIMLDNFISNSKKAGAAEMSIDFRITGKELHIYIGDNGKGVDNELSKFIFERGYTTTSGSGIGLSHVRSIVESMDGSISFKGNNFENLGKGACFEVILP